METNTEHERRLLFRRQNYAARRAQDLTPVNKGPFKPELVRSVELWVRSVREMLEPRKRR